MFFLSMLRRVMGHRMTHNVLVIEDDEHMAHLLEVHLRDIDCEVQLAHDGEKGLALARSRSWHMIILDIMLPKIDGLDVCRLLRAEENTVPILMLTARGEEMDRVLGLEIGADDYLTKPFSMRELQARVKARFRRTDKAASGASTAPPRIMARGDLLIDTEKRGVSVKGKTVQLTVKEFDLLEQLAGNPGRVYTRVQLLDLVWHHNYQGYEHTVNSHINRLRAKIEKDPARPVYIQTVWGVGYKFAEAENRENG
jgi:DNA-binding response OmpR family regulator